MSVIKCNKDHYYDDSKYEECPHCKNGIIHIAKETFIDDMGENMTAPLNGISRIVDSEIVTVALDDINRDDNVTIGAYDFSQGIPFLAGWLVAIEGPARGRDYKIFYGWNKIGRDISMDICISNDLKITRDNHVSIVYEEKKSKFYLITQSGSLTYLNNKLITDVNLIENGDVIHIGDSVFVFITFCTEERKW